MNLNQLFDIERLIQKQLERQLVEDFWPKHDVPKSLELQPVESKRPKKTNKYKKHIKTLSRKILQILNLIINSVEEMVRKNQINLKRNLIGVKKQFQSPLIIRLMLYIIE